MRSLRRRRALCCLRSPCGRWRPAAAQTLTADVNGDGVRDRIETGAPPAELVGPALQPGAGAAPRFLRFHPRRRRHRRGPGRRFGPRRDDDGSTAPADVRVDERRPRQVRLPAAEAAGPDRVPSPRPPAIRRRRAVRLPTTTNAPTTVGLVVLTSIGLQSRPMISEPLQIADEPLFARTGYSRRSPRGPPSPLLLS